MTTHGYFAGHTIVRHRRRGHTWFTVDDRSWPVFETSRSAVSWLERCKKAERVR